MARAYGRRVEVLIEPATGAARRVTGLRMLFDVRMSRDSTPQQGNISIYNPADATVSAVRSDDCRLTVTAGYGDAAAAVFVGEVIDSGVNLKRDGSDRVLVVEAADGWRKLRDGYVSITLAGRTSGRQVIDAVLAMLTVTAGRIVAPDIVFERGFTANDTARNVLNDLARSTDSEWRIIDGVLHFYPAGESIDSVRPLIASGVDRAGSLIGDAAVKLSAEGIAEVQVRSLLLPTMRPGRRFRVRTRSGIGDGDYIAQDVTHQGDSWGGEFYTEIVGRRE